MKTLYNEDKREQYKYRTAVEEKAFFFSSWFTATLSYFPVVNSVQKKKKKKKKKSQPRDESTLVACIYNLRVYNAPLISLSA